MAGRIRQSDVDEVKARTNIADRLDTSSTFDHLRCLPDRVRCSTTTCHAAHARPESGAESGGPEGSIVPTMRATWPSATSRIREMGDFLSRLTTWRCGLKYQLSNPTTMRTARMRRIPCTVSSCQKTARDRALMKA